MTTKTSAIALCGNSLALYNPPVRVAEEMAMLDCISGGRMIAGIVVGTPMDTTFCYGLPPIELRDRFKEARELVHRAWKSEEPFSFNGKYNKLRYVNTWPRPIQEDIPMWIPGSGSPETWEVVDEFDYCYGYLSFNGKKSAEPIVNGFWDYIEAHGGNMNPHRMAFTQIICCADTDEEAERQYYDAVKYFFRQNPVAREFATPPGYSTQASQRSLMSRASIITPEQRAQGRQGRAELLGVRRTRLHHRRHPRAGRAAHPRALRRTADRSADHLHARRQPVRRGGAAEQPALR